MFEQQHQRAGGDKIPTQSYRSCMAPLPTQVVADALRARLPDLDTLRLHKLLYYCQGHHLATFGTRLFGDTVSAYDNGPVVARFWYAERNDEPSPYGSREPTEAELNTIGFVASTYGRISGPDLIEQTHVETPWKRANEGREPGTSKRIEEEWMETYFREAATRQDRTSYANSPLAERLLSAGLDGDVDNGAGMRDDPAKLRDKLARLRRSIRTE